MIRTIMIAILTLGIIGTGYWGYLEHGEKNALLINAENNYQRAFHNLTYQIDTLHDQIGTSLAMNSRQSLSPALVEVWRTTSEAHQSVGQLPLTLLPFNKTEEFLSQIGNFTFEAAVRDLDDDPLTEDEYATLKKLYSQAGEIQDELRNVQHLVLKNNLRWMDVELALASGDEVTDNTIINGFKTVEKTVESYDDTELGPTFVSMKKKDDNFEKIKGKKITKDEAIEIARKYTNIDGNEKVEVTENEKGANYGFYNVTFYNEDNNDYASMDITKRGGYPIWFISNRDVEAGKLSLNEGNNKAVQFLKDNGYEKLELFESTQYDNVGLFSFVALEDGVFVYPDSIKVKVALDNGDILGFTADNYLKSKESRNINGPEISSEEARKAINKNVKIMDERLAIILDEQGKEVLCYEFLATLDNDTYRIFINSSTGKEEEVEKLKNAEPVYDDIV